MKPSILFIILISLVFILSCGKDDSGPSYEFIDQNLQGVIDGQVYEFGEGTVEEITIDEELLSFRLYHKDEEYSEVCEIFLGELIHATFTTPNEEGLYELHSDISIFDGLVVNLQNPNGEGGVPQNNLASFGAIEILSISDSEVTGRMDATLDEENTVNGNFTAIVCQ